jgi:hypothetical protein|tara:strand:+ start:763 stop:915 length:153 start_codon:yes stop_codon:yes gene_type:complete
MQKYGMFLKSGNEIIHRTDSDNLATAYNYFAKLKDMSLIAFKKLFIVTKI